MSQQVDIVLYMLTMLTCVIQHAATYPAQQWYGQLKALLHIKQQIKIAHSAKYNHYYKNTLLLFLPISHDTPSSKTSLKPLSLSPSLLQCGIPSPLCSGYRTDGMNHRWKHSCCLCYHVLIHFSNSLTSVAEHSEGDFEFFTIIKLTWICSMHNVVQYIQQGSP